MEVIKSKSSKVSLDGTSIYANLNIMIFTVSIFVFSGVMQVTMQIIREDGFLGLFRGMIPTLVREVPGYFFFFGGYELSRYLLTPKGKTVDDIGEIICINNFPVLQLSDE